MSVVKQIEWSDAPQGRVLTVEDDAPVSSAARIMKHHDVGSLVVVDASGGIVGILTERDILGKIVAAALDAGNTPVRRVMTTNVIACSLDTPITKAQQIMANKSIRHLPIIENGELLGMLSSRDILAHQLSSTRAVLRRQSRMLQQLERRHPGISEIRTDTAGRVVI
ncbi:MAG: CBS domain-containing protein [Phycisphaerae bacterium]|jgi:CBS domain-containing protein|nr:CBS domain-containing protein [Phycisphaerae bacterium]